MQSPMLPRPVRSAALATVLALLGTMLLVAVGSAPASAAAWSTVTNVHFAKLQVCRADVKGVAYLQIRLNNRAGAHAHRGGVYRTAGGKATLEVRAAKGKISPAKRIKITKGARFDTFVGEINGPSAGGGLGPSEYGRC